MSRREDRRALFWTRMHGETIELPIRLFAIVYMLFVAAGALLGEFTATLGQDEVAWRRLVGAGGIVLVALGLLSNRVDRSKAD